MVKVYDLNVDIMLPVKSTPKFRYYFKISFLYGFKGYGQDLVLPNTTALHRILLKQRDNNSLILVPGDFTYENSLVKC